MARSESRHWLWLRVLARAMFRAMARIRARALDRAKGNDVIIEM